MNGQAELASFMEKWAGSECSLGERNCGAYLRAAIGQNRRAGMTPGAVRPAAG
ncbi:MAG: hypothetical protein ACRDS9_15485 [Pseudonocardiaceae bacterium]